MEESNFIAVEETVKYSESNARCFRGKPENRTKYDALVYPISYSPLKPVKFSDAQSRAFLFAKSCNREESEVNEIPNY
jgi:hypothetical protein